MSEPPPRRVLRPIEDPGEAEQTVSVVRDRYINRELSWLSFNERVLQEAEDPSVPVYERLKFLSIFSSNLDEFFRVRVASLRSLLRLGPEKRERLSMDPTDLLKDIHDVTLAQQERFGRIFRESVVPELAAAGVHLVDELGVEAHQRSYVEQYFAEHVERHLAPVLLDAGDEAPFLKDHTVYLVAELGPSPGGEVAMGGPALGLVEVPSPELPRFLSIPGGDDRRCVMYLDDVIRLNLPRVFPGHVIAGAYAVKVSRDADLHLDDEFAESLQEAIRRSLGRRETGVPIRFLYDMDMPRLMVNRLALALGLRDEDLVLGGRYHNLHDLAGLPGERSQDLEYPAMDALAHPALDGRASILDAVAEKDRLLHFPYQSYGYVVRFLQEAAVDPDVDAIWISLYRVANDSAVVMALIEAAENGKDVSAFVEVQARFDEELNLEWAERMERAGVRTLYGRQGIKVHAKLALVRRREGSEARFYAFLATGNFNEKTARVYADHGLMTVDRRLTDEVHRVFRILGGDDVEPDFEHLLVAPFHLRDRFNALIDAETTAAREGRASGITAKMNSLQDRKIIDRLYAASAAGVPVRLVVRGISCLRPGVAGLSDNIEARSIVDRFLEHSRIFLFHADGQEKLYLASADWMTRNLNRRVEVAFPIYDADARAQLCHVLGLQLQDDTKARILDDRQSNRLPPSDGARTVRSQIDTYRYLEELLG